VVNEGLVHLVDPKPFLLRLRRLNRKQPHLLRKCAEPRSGVVAVETLREQLDVSVGLDGTSDSGHQKDLVFWENRRAEIERAARSARRKDCS